MRVEFFIVGAQRCGTTYLYRLLNQHPQIFLPQPERPEPKFFIDENKYALGLPWYLQHYFSAAKNDQIAGEKSTSYIEYKQAAKRILAKL